MNGADLDRTPPVRLRGFDPKSGQLEREVDLPSGPFGGVRAETAAGERHLDITPIGEVERGDLPLAFVRAQPTAVVVLGAVGEVEKECPQPRLAAIALHPEAGAVGVAGQIPHRAGIDRRVAGIVDLQRVRPRRFATCRRDIGPADAGRRLDERAGPLRLAVRPCDPAAQVLAGRRRTPGGEPTRGGVAHVVEQVAAVAHDQLRIDAGGDFRQFRRHHIAGDPEGRQESREIFGGEIPTHLLLSAGGEVEGELLRGHHVFIAIGHLESAPQLGRRLREIAGVEKEFQRHAELADFGPDPPDRRVRVWGGGHGIEPQIIDLDRPRRFRLLAGRVNRDSLQPKRVSCRGSRHLEIDLLPAVELELHAGQGEVAPKVEGLAAVGLRLHRPLAKAELEVVGGIIPLDPELERSRAGDQCAIVAEIQDGGATFRIDRIVKPAACQPDLGIGGVRFGPDVGAAWQQRRKVLDEMVRLARRRRRQRDEEKHRANHGGGEIHLGESVAGEGDSGSQRTARFSASMYVRGGDL